MIKLIPAKLLSAVQLPLHAALLTYIGAGGLAGVALVGGARGSHGGGLRGLRVAALGYGFFGFYQEVVNVQRFAIADGHVS